MRKQLSRRWLSRHLATDNAKQEISESADKSLKLGLDDGVIRVTHGNDVFAFSKFQIFNSYFMYIDNVIVDDLIHDRSSTWFDQ